MLTTHAMPYYKLWKSLQWYWQEARGAPTKLVQALWQLLLVYTRLLGTNQESDEVALQARAR